MTDTDKKYCREMLDIIMEHGVREIVISPGSRNAPILIAASKRDDLKKYVICDERNASFFALGLSMVSRRPVSLCCTSGTALYNYAPAIAEAYYQNIPLIVISADRPIEWIGQNDSQTLFQNEALQKIVKKSFDIPLDSTSDDTAWFVNRSINEAMIEAISGIPGPVHINIRFEAPLSNVEERHKEEVRIIRQIPAFPYFHPQVLKDLSAKLTGKRIMVVAGFMPPDNALNKSVAQFCELPQTVLLAETLSNLHLSGNPYSIDTVLSGLTPDEKRKLAPDIVISIGGAPVSRILKEFIRSYDNCQVWTLGDSPVSIDCFKKLSLHIDIAAEIFFKALYSRLKKQSASVPYQELWDSVKVRQLEIRHKFVKETSWSELKAFQYILSEIPSDWNLFLSNGTPVRYAQLFTEKVPHASFSNRGVSGIEGTTATAAGCATAYKGTTLLVTGDMSFSYAPGVLGIQDLTKNFKIIVINNKGGGIFRFISPTRYIDCRDEYFCADPKVPVEGLANAYNWEYIKVETLESLKIGFKKLIESDSNVIMEVISDEEYSASILRKYMRLNGLV